MSLAAAANLLDQMPEAPKLKPRVFDPPPGHFWCACAKKAVPVAKMRYVNTPFLSGCSDSLCDECLKSVTGMGLIVCVKCRSVVARMAHTRFPSGFQVRAGECYHTEACPNCVPNVRTSIIIEKRLFDEANGIAVKPIN